MVHIQCGDFSGDQQGDFFFLVFSLFFLLVTYVVYSDHDLVLT
jgi:hypothetical protein